MGSGTARKRLISTNQLRLGGECRHMDPSEHECHILPQDYPSSVMIHMNIVCGRSVSGRKSTLQMNTRRP